MKPTLLRTLLAFALLVLGASAAGQGVDLLKGEAADVPLCALTPATAAELFGIPSRKLLDDASLTVEYSHHGFVLRFAAAAADVEQTLHEIEVYPVDRDGFLGYRGHFLGTVASGTARDPVERILRSARAGILAADATSIRARLTGFELDIAFLYGVIDAVKLRCDRTEEGATL